MKSPVSLKRYLALHFGAVSILPVITIAGLVWFFMMPSIQHQTRIQHQALARSIADKVSIYLEGGERQLDALAGFLQNRQFHTDPEVVSLLDAHCGSGEFFETLFIVDDATVTTQAVGLPQSRRSNRADFMGLDLSGQRFVDAMKKGRRVGWSQTFLSTISNRVAVALMVPLSGGFIIGEITLDKLSAYIRNFAGDSDFFTLVVDRQGMIVADSRNLHVGEVLRVAFPDATGSAGHIPAAAKAFEWDGQRMLGTLVEMDAAGWKVLVAQPSGKAFQPLRDTFGLIGLGLVIALGLVLAASWPLAGRFAGLFTSYTEQAESIADGRYALQWPAAKVMEFVRLGQSLARMAEKISQREKALVGGEARLKNLTANVPGVVIQFRSTRDHVYTNEFLNAKVAEIFGLEPDSETILDQFYACIPDAEKEVYIACMREAVDTVSPWNYEGRFNKPDGETIWFSGHALPQVEGDTIVYYGVLLDTTERKQMEQALKESEERLDMALEGANEGLWDLSLNEKTFYFDSRYYTMAGYAPNEFPGSFEEVLKRIHENDQERIQSSFLQFLSGDLAIYEVQFRFLRKDGTYMWILSKGKTVSRDAQGNPIRFVGTNADITDLKMAQEELRRLRNYLSNIIDSMPSILVAVDGEGRVTQWNRQAAQATGLSFEAVRSRPLAQVFPRLAGEMARIRTAIRERRVISVPKVSRKMDRETRYEDVTIFPLVANGVEGAVIRVDDVTQQVRLEEMMIQSEKMLSVGGLAAGMAHEINNPLAGILQNASVLENRLLGDIRANRKAAEAAGTTLSAIRHYLEQRKLPGMIENIRESGSRAAAIVRNMLSFARKSDRRFSSHDLGTLLDQTLELVRTDYDMKKQYDVKQIHIERAYDPLVPLVPCEASKLQQVFMNILKNGAEAMADVKDASVPPAFVLRVSDDGAWVRVEIQDNGPGMDETTRRRIFEPFFTTKPVGRGTGLGLSVSYFIVTEDHGGEMHVRAVEGGGTCFVIRLPKGGPVVGGR